MSTESPQTSAYDPEPEPPVSRLERAVQTACIVIGVAVGFGRIVLHAAREAR